VLGGADDPRKPVSGLAARLVVCHAADRARGRVPAATAGQRASVHTAGPAVAPPGWLTRGGCGYASEDGVTWHLIREVTLGWLGSPAHAVTSHNNRVLTRAIFENVRLSWVLSR
jgi:hypothetical protein